MTSNVTNIPPVPVVPHPNIEVSPHIKERLEKIARQEGRREDEIIREAIAEWLKERER